MRKVRYKSQLEAMIDYSVEADGKQFTKRDIGLIIQRDRARRESIRLKIIQGGSRVALRHFGDPDSTIYDTLSIDTLAFARNIGIMQVQDNVVICPPPIRRIHRVMRTDPGLAQELIIKLLLVSKYKAYLGFLSRLQAIGSYFVLPKDYITRTKKSGLRDFLQQNGFLTDVASFFTIRDLFYDLSLVNWGREMTSGDDRIFLTCKIDSLGGSKESHEYQRSVDLDGGRLSYDKVVGRSQFVESLTENYLSLTGKHWGKVVELLELRDKVCVELNLSNSGFNASLLSLRNAQGLPFELDLSQGTMTYRAGILTKVLNLPEIGNDRYAVYIRLTR